MKSLPFDQSIATAVLSSMTGKMVYSPRAACGENGISYNDLLRWLAENEDFAYDFELALAKRIQVMEKNFILTNDPLGVKIFGTLLEVANPEAFSVSKGQAHPGNKGKPATAPFSREFIDTESSNESRDRRVVKLKTSE